MVDMDVSIVVVSRATAPFVCTSSSSASSARSSPPTHVIGQSWMKMSKVISQLNLRHSSHRRGVEHAIPSIKGKINRNKSMQPSDTLRFLGSGKATRQCRRLGRSRNARVVLSTWKQKVRALAQSWQVNSNA